MISWVPVETGAQILLDMAETDPVSKFSIFHLRHPKPLSWHDMMACFSELLGVPVISYAEWLSKLTRTLEKPDPLTSEYVAPALRLLQMWQSASDLDSAQRQTRILESNGFMVLLDIEESSRRCAALSNPSFLRLSIDDVRKWVEYWRSIRALPPAA